MAGVTMLTSTLDLSLFDTVLAKAHAEGIDAARVEIRPSSAPDKAWTVTEIDRRWPTQVDAVAIDAATLAVVDKVVFAQYPLAAKLTRWGIDAHMGVLFGLANQLVLIVFATGLVVLVVMGYLMWWRRRPTRALSGEGCHAAQRLAYVEPRRASRGSQRRAVAGCRTACIGFQPVGAGRLGCMADRHAQPGRAC